jgi:hypothetical protein
MEGMIGNIPWGIGYRYEKFGLISLDDGYVPKQCTGIYVFCAVLTVYSDLFAKQH